MGQTREPHEGSWMYLSTAHGSSLGEGVQKICRRHGWPVLAASEQPAHRRLQALRLADACIVEVSAFDGARDDLAIAVTEGRPVIALHLQLDEDAWPADLAFADRAVQRVSCREVDDCLAALDRVLGDEDWQEQVAQAAPYE